MWIPDLAYPSGYRTWNTAKQSYVDAKAANTAFSYLRPTSVGVPVVTLLGGYVPADASKAVLYPAFRSNYGNTFDYPAPATDAGPATRQCARLNCRRCRKSWRHWRQVNCRLLSKTSKTALASWHDSLDLLSPTAKTVAESILGAETAADNAARFMRYYADTLSTSDTQIRFKKLLLDSGLTPFADTPTVPSGTVLKVDRGNSGIAGGYCLMLYTTADGTFEARVPTAGTAATECTGATYEKWFMDVRGAVHNGAHPELCLTSSNPSRPSACDSSNGTQQWKDLADGHLRSVATPGRSLDLNRSTRLPILYNTSTGSNQKWTGLSSSTVLAMVLVDSASIKKMAELGLQAFLPLGQDGPQQWSFPYFQQRERPRLRAVLGFVQEIGHCS